MRRTVGLWALTAVLAVAGVSGCGGGEGPSADEIVARTAAETGKVRSFHFVFAIEHVPTGGTGLSLTFAEGDIVVPNRLRADVGGTFLGVPLRSQLVVVDGAYYLKNPLSGKWETIEAKTNPVAFFDPAKGVLGVIKGATDLERTGSEEVDAVASYRIAGKVKVSDLTALLGNPPSDRLVPVQLWIGEEDYLLRRLRLTGPVAASEPEDAVRTVEVSNHDEAVTIEPPVQP